MRKAPISIEENSFGMVTKVSLVNNGSIQITEIILAE